MEISIDESGSFAVKGASKNSWCVVLAFACPESDKTKSKNILTKLKRQNNVNIKHEIKLGQVSETSFSNFLKELNELDAVLLSVATDSGLNLEASVKRHQERVVFKIMENIDEMQYEEGKDAVRILSSQLKCIPVQLYIQLQCQNNLIESFIRKGINYFVQRAPNSLRRFRWRIDQKSPDKKTDFEDAFEKFCPLLLQSLSLREPSVLINEWDYSPMSKYMFKKGEVPNYLVDKFPELKDGEGLDIQKIVREDIHFIDSTSHQGVQIADLLASGLRKLLRLEFDNNEQVAHYLGGLMIQEEHNNSPIKLSTFGSEANTDEQLSRIIRIMIKSCRPMFKK